MADVDTSNGTVKLLKQLDLTSKSMFPIYVRVISKNKYIGPGVPYKIQRINLKIQVLYIHVIQQISYWNFSNFEVHANSN